MKTIKIGSPRLGVDYDLRAYNLDPVSMRFKHVRERENDAKVRSNEVKLACNGRSLETSFVTECMLWTAFDDETKTLELFHGQSRFIGEVREESATPMTIPGQLLQLLLGLPRGADVKSLPVASQRQYLQDRSYKNGCCFGW